MNKSKLLIQLKHKNMNSKKDSQQESPDRTVLGAERSLMILNAFIDARNALSVKELEQRTGLFKSVICRYLISFVRHGYLVQKEDKSYQLGPKIYQLGKSFEKQFSYADFIIPTLKKIVELTKESAAFFVKQNDQRICLYALDSYEPVKAIVKTGSVFNIDNTSSAQILRFFSDPKNLYQSDGKYISVSSGVNNALSSSMSAPVFGYNNSFIGALTIFGITARFIPADNQLMRHILLLLAQELSTQLGAQDAYLNPTDDVFEIDAVAVDKAMIVPE